MGYAKPYNLLFRSLKQSEEQIRLLLNTTAEAIFGCDLNGICTFCNHACVRLLGYKHQDELIGKNMHYLMHHSHADGTSVPFEECPTFQMGKRGEHLHYEDAILWRADGTCFHAEYWNHLQRVGGEAVGITGSFYDITKRKQMEEALQAGEQWHRRVAENMSDVIWAMDFTGRIIYISPSIMQMLGYTPEEATQLTYEQMTTPSSLGLVHQKFEEALAMATANQRIEIDCFETEFFRKDGSTAWGELSVSGMYDTSGNAIGFQGMTRDITKRKQMEEALRDSEQRYRTLLENAPDGFIFHDVNGKIFDVNRRICELLGYSREELINERVFVFEVGIKPESLLEHTWVMPEAEFPTTVFGVHRRKDGSTYPAEIHLNWIRIDGQRMIMAMVRDITQRKMAEDALREQTQLLSTVIDGIPDVIALQKPDQTIIRYNKAGYVFHGLPPDEVRGRKCYEVLGRDAPCEICATKIALKTKQISLVEKFLPERNIWIEDRSIPVLDEQGKVYLIVEELRDISDRKRMEEEQARYNATLEAKNKALAEYSQMAESATRAKSAFLANMSHEIRTPMTAILGYAQHLLHEEGLEKAPPHRVEAFRTIERNGQHLLRLINDILDLTKIESGKFETERIMCSPLSILADVTSMMRVHAIGKKLPLKLEYASPIPQTINTDPTRLKQILVNLVNNAIKFTETGEVRIVVRLLKGDGENHKLCFDIIDTGIGITPDQIKLLFQHFTQADASTSRKFGGTGLGLAISKRLAELLGGDITVSSIPQTGSTFTFTISTGPLEEIKMIDNPSEAICQNAKKIEPLQAQGSLLNCRILLAEDTPDIQNLIKMLLAEAGANVTTVDNGQLAVEAAWAAHREGNAFDIILMDMQMPIMDGYEATRKIRSEGYDGQIIALTAHSMQGDREKCLEAGCGDFISKPIDPDRLIEIVAKSMNSKATEKRSEHADSMVEAPGNEDILHSQYADRPVIARMLGEFVGRLDDRVRAMQAALGSAQTEDLRRLAHQLKGSAGSYGYPSLSAAAKALEDDARLGRPESAAKDLEHIVALCRAVLKGWNSLPQPALQ
ncbi:MAG: PAS domain S-box protein [Thermoguttaceae bacterium]